MWLRKSHGDKTSAEGPLYLYTSKEWRDKDLKDKPSEMTIVAEKTKKTKKLQADQQRSQRNIGL